MLRACYKWKYVYTDARLTINAICQTQSVSYRWNNVKIEAVR
jgi:hypothetical protein